MIPMYIEYFGLKEAPFSIAPDPRFFFMSDRHKEALTHLTYGLQGAGGFVMLTGEVGTGKTTVSRALVESLSENTAIAYVHNPAISEMELLETLCDQFELEYDNQLTIKRLFDLLHQHLLQLCQQGQACVVIVDEAQLLSTAALEQLRLLTNLDFEHKKLLHIVLIGQPELQDKLKQPELRQLAQRIAARYHLLPLTETELTSYIAYRLSIAAGSSGLFSRNVIKLLHKETGGVPRLVNLICDKALYFAFKNSAERVSAKHVERAVSSVFVTDVESKVTTKQTSYILGLVVAALLTSGLTLFILNYFSNDQQVPTAAVVTSTSVVDDIDVDTLLPAIEQATVPNIAVQNLFRIWGYDIAQTKATCLNASYAGLRCLQQQGIYRELVQYNLPAVVRLRQQDIGDYYAVLVSATEAGIELLIDNEHVLVTQAWFQRYWLGEYQLLWQSPARFKTSLKLNDTGALVTWVDNVLSDELAQPKRFTDVFDQELTQRVMVFQRQQRLTADGIVGQKTMMMLVNVSDNSLPRLTDTTYMKEAQ